MINQVTLGGMQGAAVGAGPKARAAGGSGTGARAGAGPRGTGTGTGACDGSGRRVRPPVAAGSQDGRTSETSAVLTS